MNDGPKDRWRVHVYGPDDLLEITDELSALREANKLNAWWLTKRDPNDPNEPILLAIAERVEERAAPSQEQPG